jgi:hypothetical protein
MSNRKRAASAPRKGRTLLGGKTNDDGQSSIALRHKLAPVVKTTATFQGRRQSTQARIPKAWSDTYHKPASSVEYSSEYIASLKVRAAYHNPRKPTANASTLRYQEWSDKAGMVITKQKTIDLSYRDGSAKEYQAPAKRLLWRGEETLFDNCATIEARISDMRPRDLFIGDVITNRSTKAKIAYHKLDQPLPAWNVRQIDKPAKVEAIAAVHAWRMAKQLAHAEALIELASR